MYYDGMSKFLPSIFLLWLIPQIFYANFATKKDSIPSGVPFQIEGEIVSLNTLPTPIRLTISSKIIATKTSSNYPVRTKTIPFPEPSQMIVMGENGVPFPTTEVAKPIKKRMNLPNSQTVLPLNYIDKKKSTLQSLDVHQGLPTALIRSVIHTKNGQYWMGSDPYLIQYDGKAIRTFDFGVQSKNRVFQDQEENIWVHSVDYKGLLKYDGNYYYQFDNSIEQKRILRILQDSNKNLWFSQEYGLYKFDGKVFTHYSSEILPFPIRRYRIDMLLEDNEQNIWINTQAGALHFQNDRFLFFDVEKASGLKPLFQDQEGTIWFSYDDQFCAYRNDSLVCFSSNLMEQYRIYSATTIDENRVLLIYSSEEGSNQIVANTILNIRTLSEEQAVDLPNGNYIPSTIDQFGSTWHCVPYNGVHRYPPGAFKQAQWGLETIFYQDNVTSFLEDHHKNIWFGPHHNALYKFDGKHYHQYDLPSIKRCLLEDQTGSIWIGGGQFYKFDGQHFYDYNIDPNNRKTIFGITEDQEGNLWYGGNSNQLTKFDGKTFTHYELYPPIIRDKTSYKDIRALLTDKN